MDLNNEYILRQDMLINNYIVKFSILQESYFCIWHTDKIDVFWIEGKKIKYFYDLKDLKKFCKEFGINIEEEITEYDVNKLVKWMMIQNKEIDCEYLLNMWNIITDFATSIGEDFNIDDTEVHHIYNKLFYGNNLSSINTSEKQYNPIFNEHEQNLLINVFTKGVSILEKEFNLKLLY